MHDSGERWYERDVGHKAVQKGLQLGPTGNGRKRMLNADLPPLG